MLRIGIDFDNTIVSYDVLFHKVALEQGVIPSDLPVSKLAVRDYLRKVGQEDVWTAMQGEVYGARLLEADPYPGVIEFFRKARSEGLELRIVSHKTKTPFLGPQYDLHEAARGWIHKWLVDETGWLIDDQNIFFEVTKDAKWARIGTCGCSHFIDDLPEILNSPSFPAQTVPILFSPDGPNDAVERVMTDWTQINAFIGA